MNNRQTTAGLGRPGCLAHAGRRLLAGGALLATMMAVQAAPAAADFRLCNNTGSRVGISLGYKEKVMLPVAAPCGSITTV